MSCSVTFWGTRGTIPVPGDGTARYGGNTSCVAVRDAEGRCLMLDAGTGIRRLGHALRSEAFAGRIDLLLSHVHWDHIQGLPFFPPMFADGQDIHIHGPAPVGAELDCGARATAGAGGLPGAAHRTRRPAVGAGRYSRTRWSRFPDSGSSVASSLTPVAPSATGSRRTAAGRSWPT